MMGKLEEPPPQTNKMTYADIVRLAEGRDEKQT